MAETPAGQDRHQDLEDPRVEAAAGVKRRREADTAASRPAPDPPAPAGGASESRPDGTSQGDAAAPTGAPAPPPGTQP